MAREDSTDFWVDVTEEMEVEQSNDEAVDNILEKVYTANLEGIAAELTSLYAVELEEDQIERIILDYNLDTSSEEITKQVYNIYMKEYS